MTSIPDLLRERLGVGRTVRLELEETEEGTLVGPHPNPDCEYDVSIVEGVDALEERPPSTPVEVEILGRFVDGNLAGRIVGPDREEGADGRADADDR